MVLVVEATSVDSFIVVCHVSNDKGVTASATDLVEVSMSLPTFSLLIGWLDNSSLNKFWNLLWGFSISTSSIISSDISCMKSLNLDVDKSLIRKLPVSPLELSTCEGMFLAVTGNVKVGSKKNII